MPLLQLHSLVKTNCCIIRVISLPVAVKGGKNMFLKINVHVCTRPLLIFEIKTNPLDRIRQVVFRQQSGDQQTTDYVKTRNTLNMRDYLDLVTKYRVYTWPWVCSVKVLPHCDSGSEWNGWQVHTISNQVNAIHSDPCL